MATTSMEEPGAGQTLRRRGQHPNPVLAIAVERLEAAAHGNRALQLVADVVPAVIGLSYGFVCFTIALLAGFVATFTRRATPETWRKLAESRTRQWDLAQPHPSGLKHAFHTLDGGVTLHYLTNAKSTGPVKKTKHLVIFWHGFPDCSAIWGYTARKLPRSVTSQTTLVAADLPGFGGSDSVPEYGPDEVLTAMTEFSIDMRRKYLDETSESKVLVVGFDWGGIAAFRLSYEAPQLADRWIMANTMHAKIQTSAKIFKSWRTNPTNVSLFFKAFTPLGVLGAQVVSSSYIFVFNLPWVLARTTTTGCNYWLLRWTHSIAYGSTSITDTDQVIEDVAGYLGPLNPKYDPSAALTYPESVCKRQAAGEAASEPIKFYRYGLSSRPWTKSAALNDKLSALDEQNAARRSTGGRKLSVTGLGALPGAIGAPVTVLWGDKDFALDQRMFLDNIDEYMPRHSHIVHLPHLGHFTPKQGDGPAVIAAAVEWALEHDEADRGALLAGLRRASSKAKMTLFK